MTCRASISPAQAVTATPFVGKLKPPNDTMKINVGGLDRIVRIIAGLVILGAGYYYKSWWGLIGLGPLLSGIFQRCPAYLPFGLSTGSKPETTPEAKP